MSSGRRLDAVIADKRDSQPTNQILNIFQVKTVCSDTFAHPPVGQSAPKGVYQETNANLSTHIQLLITNPNSVAFSV